MTWTTIPAVGQYGVAADAIPQELPSNAWSSSLNVRFADGEAQKHGATVEVLQTPSATPYFLLPYRTSTKRFWLKAGLATIYADDGATATDVTPGTAPTGTADNIWTGGVIGGVAVLNNGKDSPWYWTGDTSGDFTLLTGKGWDANWRAKSLRPFKEYLVALNVTKTATVYPHMVKWSKAAEPGLVPDSWDETDATIDAGEIDLAETTDQLVDQLPMGDINVIYKERSMYSMQYIGPPFIFRFTKLPGEIGALSQNCVVDTPVGHVVLGPGDVVVHNGQGPRSILTGRLRRWLFNTMDATTYNRCFLATDPRKSEVWICSPVAGGTVCTRAITWNWQSDTLGIRELPNVTHGAAGQISYAGATSWNSDTDTWEEDYEAWDSSEYSQAEGRLLLANTTPTVQMVDTGSGTAGVAFTSTLERTGLTFDAPDAVKTIRGVIPRVSAFPGCQLSIQLGASMDAETAPTWGTAVTYTVGTTRKADAFATGRFLALRITSSDKRAWRIKSIDVDLVTRGMY